MVLALFPTAPDGATGPAIEYSFAGAIGMCSIILFAPIGFNWQISVALIPGLAAREVLVSALGTVYSIAGDDAGVVVHHCTAVVAGDGVFTFGVVCVRAAVFVDDCGDQARNRRLENAVDHDGIFVSCWRIGLVHHLSCCTCVVVSFSKWCHFVRMRVTISGVLTPVMSFETGECGKISGLI